MYNEESAFDIKEVLKKAVKYFVEGTMVAIAAFFIPEKKIKLDEIVMIGLTAAATFALLDMYAPSVGNTARQGAGFGIGAGLVQWPGLK
tara:strand:+ start:796 stop:1062 length:267 start_codon:yes stop_codon:yes gene_type:complete